MRWIRFAMVVAMLGLLAGSTFAPGAFASGGHRRPVSRSSSAGYSSLEQAVRAGALDRLLLRRIRSGPAGVLVTFRGGAALADAVSMAPAGPRGTRARAILRDVRPAYADLKSAALRGLAGATVVRSYRALPVAFVRVSTPRVLRALLNRPEVAGIGANRIDHVDLTESLPLIHQPQAAAAGYIGTGTSVAVMDTGVDYLTYPDERSAFGNCTAVATPSSCKVVYEHDFAPDDGVLDDRSADGHGGHGTNVAAIVAGVAPGTKILAMDVFPAGTGAHRADVVAAIDFAVLHKADYDIAAMNLSLGASLDYHTTPCGDATNAYAAAFANAVAAGIMPVVAAGNDAYPGGVFRDGIATPACTPGAMSVGAVYDSALPFAGITWGEEPDTCHDAGPFAADRITCFSQTGPLLTVLAPGSSIVAAGIKQSGTSQASPHVAGSVAVLAAANPCATLEQIRNAIANSGPTITDPRNGLVRHRLDLQQAAAAVAAPGLCVSKAGDGSGTVTSGDSPQTINCGSTCTAAYGSGTPVTLTASPDAGSTFAGWSGCDSTTGATCTVTVTHPTQVTATFDVVAPSFLPDALIGLTSTGAFTGDGVYDPLGGASQTLARSIKRGKSGSFFIEVTNDGTQVDQVYVKGPGNFGKFSVRYLDVFGGSTVTSSVKAGTLHYDLEPDEHGLIQVIVSVGRLAPAGAARSWRVTLTSLGDPSAADAVVARVTARA
jgi:hypothetical protein